jgi:hypothetical protein
VTDAPAAAGQPGAGPGPTPGSSPATFLAVDRGTATCAAALVGRVERRWRLLAATAVPAGIDPAVPAALLVERARTIDPGLAAAVGLGAPRVDLAHLEATGSPAQVAAVLAATESTLRLLVADASAAGWRTLGASAEEHDPLATTRLATRSEVTALVIGTADPAASDERDLVAELVALAAGVAERRPGIVVVLVGAAAAHVASFPLGTEVVAVPRPNAEDGSDLRSVLAGRRARPGDARQALVAATGTIADLLGLRVELLEVGMSGALRVRAAPALEPGGPTQVAAMEVPGAALAMAEDDAALDRVEAWVTLGIDRARLRDRLAEIRLAPWVDLEGEGAILRAAALRAALGRLISATDAHLGGPAPDLVVLAGGAWSSMPAPAALLVLADAVRRAGVVQVAVDAARLLAPLGTIGEPAERARLLGDLLPDALVALGTLITPRGVRGGRAAGHLRLVAGDDAVEIDFAAGGLALVDLPPGQAGAAELAFRSAVDLGARGRRFAVRATGGLAGLVVDLRDIPLHLPERTDERRDLLSRWERALWPDRDR